MMDCIILDMESLIKSVESKPVLWHKAHQNYKERVPTKKAWEMVCEELNEEFKDLNVDERNAFGKEVIRRWFSIRDAYLKSFRKAKEEQLGGVAAKRKGYLYNKQLSFLAKNFESEPNEGGSGENDGDEFYFGVPESVDESVPNPRTNPEGFPRGTVLKRVKQEQLQPNPEASSGVRRNRHLSFFEGVAPSLESFNRDEVLQFQVGVLNLISSINQKKRRVLPNQDPSSMPLDYYAHQILPVEAQPPPPLPPPRPAVCLDLSKSAGPYSVSLGFDNVYQPPNESPYFRALRNSHPFRAEPAAASYFRPTRNLNPFRTDSSKFFIPARGVMHPHRTEMSSVYIPPQTMHPTRTDGSSSVFIPQQNIHTYTSESTSTSVFPQPQNMYPTPSDSCPPVLRPPESVLPPTEQLHPPSVQSEERSPSPGASSCSSSVIVDFS